jgi:hypothetical protein
VSRILQEPVEEASRDAGEAGLRTDEGAREDGTCLVLASAVDRVEHSGFKIIAEAGCQIVGDR